MSSQTTHSPVDVVIMAAGKGTRMKSALPKVLHRLAGRPMLAHVLDCTQHLHARKVLVVTGHGAPEIEASFPIKSGTKDDFPLNFVLQEPQLGTGHAVQQTMPLLADDGVTLVLSGDVPLIEAATLRALLDACAGTQLALLTLHASDPTGYGRVVRQGTNVQAIVEEKDADASQRQVQEVYSGVMAAPTRLLRGWLAKLQNNNAQGEFYLTDVVKFAVADGVRVVAQMIDDEVQVMGVNSPAQLAQLERIYQLRQAQQLMVQGVRLADPARLDVRGHLQCGQDVEIDVNCVFEGKVSLGDGVRVGANCVITHAQIAKGAVIAPFTHIQGASVGERAQVGPFARLRPGTELGADVHIGNFVEVKNSTLAAGAKANHLAYVGDASVGERVNYGAGSITANYDGAHKHRTVIESDVHVGSNCVLVAPVTLGQGGTVGAGSTITKDTAPASLTLTRSKQVSVPGWQRPTK